MRCLIVEDDPIARAVLEAHARRAGLEVVASAADVAEARRLAVGDTFDVAFTDIELPDGSGLDLARDLVQRAQVVLATARERYAVDAYDLGAADYLLKPVAYERFAQAVERVRKGALAERAAEPAAEPAALTDGALPDGPVFVRSGGELVRVDLRAVPRIEAERDYVRLHGPGLRVQETMKALAARLPPPFVRIHRSHIARLDRIEAVAEAQAVVAGERVPIGASYRAALADRLRTL